MGDFNQIAESEFRKASLLSELRFRQNSQENDPSKLRRDPPKDKYYLGVLTFFFLGFGGMVHMSFFLTATDYWMYKFRDINQDHYDANNKTYLQTNFASISSIIHSIPTVITTILVSIFGHKLNVRLRLMGTLTVLTASFVVFTIFVVVDTDSWQIEFFILTMAVSVVTSIAGILLGVTNFAIMAKFPQSYLKIHMYGSTTGGLFSSILQVLCLSTGGSSIQVGLMYYICGTSILVMTLFMAYITKYLPLFHYYMGDTVAATRKPLPTLVVIKAVAKRMWPLIIPMLWGLPTFAWSSPSILILVVPEDYDRDDPWTGKYFIPVITFLMPSIIGLISRVWAKPILTPKNAKWFVAFSFVKTFTMNPCFLFCNVQPRHHLPVLFSHDWQYITLLAVSSFVNDFMATVHFVSTPNLAGDRTEEALILMQTIGMVLGSAFSPLTAVWINKVL